ncbi:long-chain fatty acid--CoA ligase [Marinilabiliaceae bacterium JC017]|nr:long-chain fatty acid--CoA ligase [Marinilabiliaceae bacterium JC017]
MILNLGEKTALVNGDKRISYDDLHHQSNVFAQLYSEEKTNKVVIFSENRVGWVYAFYSIWINDAIAIPVDFMSSLDDVAYILNDCRPEVIFVSKEKQMMLTEAINRAGISPKVFVIDDYEAIQPRDKVQLANIASDDEKTAVIIYTSGTTGSPKGVMLSFKNLKANIAAIHIDVPIYNPDDRVMMLLPLHHIFPLMGTLVGPLNIGAQVALAPSMASEDILKTLQENKITILIGVPRLYTAIYKGIKDKIEKSPVAKALFNLAAKINSYAFSRMLFKSVHQKFGGAIRFMVAGGAALDPEVGNTFRTLGFEVLEGFGMTEAAPMITFTRPGKVKIGSPGHVLPLAKVEIRDKEIVVKGPNVMQGYYNRPEETAEVLKDGWLYTGDLGYFDEQGYLYITGRKKEIIVLSNGKNINPVEIEQKLESYAAFISEVGVYQEKDQLRAIIVPSPELMKGADVAAIHKEIKWLVIDKYNQGVTPYKKIMFFSIYNGELPRTRLGKLRRFKLAELNQENQEQPEQEEQIDLKEYHIIKEYLEKEKSCRVRPDHHIEFDLGLDSLDKVSLQVFLSSTFGVEIEIPQLVGFTSVLKLSEYISHKRVKMEVEKINWTKILKEKVTLHLPRTWVTGRIFVKLTKYFFRIYFRFKGRGINNIPEGPCIIAPNHQSYFDGLFVASFLKRQTIKNTYFYAKEKHIRQRWMKFLANRNNIIIMDLNRDLKESIQKMGEALKKKKNLIIFPEGTRTVNGKLGDFKKTFAILSRELNVPIVPVSIKGAYDALPKGSKFPKPFKKVSVEFLKPIYPENSTYEKLVDRVFTQIFSNQVANGR